MSESVKYIGNTIQVYDQYQENLPQDKQSCEVYKNIARGCAAKSKAEGTPHLMNGTQEILNWEPEEWVVIAIAIAFNLGYQTGAQNNE